MRAETTRMLCMDQLHAFVAERAEFWWKKLRAIYPQISPKVPAFKLNNRLKATAGRAFLELQTFDLSTDYLKLYPEQIGDDTIPHELAHLVAWTLYQDKGHGLGWKSVIKAANIKTDRLHNMVNVLESARKLQRTKK